MQYTALLLATKILVKHLILSPVVVNSLPTTKKNRLTCGIVILLIVYGIINKNVRIKHVSSLTTYYCIKMSVVYRLALRTVLRTQFKNLQVQR